MPCFPAKLQAKKKVQHRNKKFLLEQHKVISSVRSQTVLSSWQVREEGLWQTDEQTTGRRKTLVAKLKLNSYSRERGR